MSDNNFRLWFVVLPDEKPEDDLDMIVHAELRAWRMDLWRATHRRYPLRPDDPRAVLAACLDRPLALDVADYPRRVGRLVPMFPKLVAG